MSDESRENDLLIANVPGLGRAIPAEDARRILGLSRQGIQIAVRRGNMRGLARARVLWIRLGDVRRYQLARLADRQRKNRKTGKVKNA